MDVTLPMILIICPLVFLAGFIDAVAGGGGLISLPAYLAAGLPAHLAAGTNKMSAAISTVAATWRFATSGRVLWRLALIAAGMALVGAAIGTRLALLMSERMLRIVMLCVLPVVAVFCVVKKPKAQADTALDPKKEPYLACIIGLIVGLYDGLVGPGTGTFMIMAFTAVMGMDLLTASGCAKVSNLASNVASAVVFILNAQVLWPVAVPAALCNMLGNITGARYAIRGGSKKVRGMMFVVLGLLFATMIYELVV